MNSQTIKPKAKLIDKLKVITPLSYMWILRKSIGEAKTILDLGCGDGNLMAVVAQGKKWEITGADIHAGSLKKTKEKGLYKDLIRGDILQVVKKLTKADKKYDVVFFSQVIEHIPRKMGEQILDTFEKLAQKRIIVGTPKGFMHQPEEFLGNNPHQVHQSGWEEEDFRKRGYRVFGIGFEPIWSEHGLGRTKNKPFFVIYTLIGYLLSPLVYYFPYFAAGLLCIKEIKKRKKL